LHYTISLSPYHQEVTEALQRFLKWNLDIVAESKDFLEMDVNILIVLLQQNDLVLRNEYDLFGYVESWILYKNILMQNDSNITDEEKQTNITQLIESVVVYIRFAMMTPSELAKLVLQPVYKLHKDFFANQIAIGLSYHSGHEDQVASVRATENGALQFTPRLYTSDMYGLSMKLPNFESIENYQTFAACFFSQSNLSESQEDQSMQWNIDFYPRGIKYSKAQMINVFNSAVEVPETILRTIRLSVTCKRDLNSEQRFKVGVLITGVQNKIPHIRTVHVRTHYFSKENRILNMDNLLPYDELALSSIKLSSHLIGNERNTLSLQIIIAPMGKYVCHDTPPFEFK